MYPPLPYMKPASKGNAQSINRSAAVAQFNKGNPDPLKSLCLKEISTCKDDFCHVNLGVIHARAGNHADALRTYLDGLGKFPNSSKIHANLSKIYLDQRKWQLACEHSKKAMDIDPGSAVALINHAYANNMLGLNATAEDSAREAVRLVPNHVGAMNNLANAILAQGRVQEAVGVYLKALNLSPTEDLAYTNLMLALMYDATADIGDITDLARRYSLQFERDVAKFSHDNSPIPHRRLRIGFISPDFTSHAVMYFAEPVLSRLPREQFEIYCYFTYAAGDAVTDRVKGYADKFTTVSMAHPEQVASTIKHDQVDILIDLAGHTAKSGLRAMAYKPAPVQVTWLGYPGTTGLRGIDWRITDHVADPTGSDSQYTEKLIRLPGCFAVYRPHIRSVVNAFQPEYQVSEPPVLRNGYITFGSCNNIAKISDESIAAWSEVLKRVPLSVMLIEGKDIDHPSLRERFESRFAQHDIRPERLRLVPRDSTKQYLTYHQIDICLDTFPLTGGTTTFDALWMGAPVVSLEGRTFRERLSTTILRNGGFKEDVCRTIDSYVEHAVTLGSDACKLADRRRGQRATMQASVLMDETRYVKLFSQALRMIWNEWCKSREPAGLPLGRPAPPGQDVLIEVNKQRITLPWALNWLRRLRKQIEESGTQEMLESSQALALAIVNVVPEQKEAVEVLIERQRRLEQHRTTAG